MRNTIGSETGFPASESSQPNVKISTANDDSHHISVSAVVVGRIANKSAAYPIDPPFPPFEEIEYWST